MRRAVKVWRLPRNPVANVDRFRTRHSGDIEVFSPEEVRALVRAAASEADAAMKIEDPKAWLAAVVKTRKP